MSEGLVPHSTAFPKRAVILPVCIMFAASLDKSTLLQQLSCLREEQNEVKQSVLLSVSPCGEAW